jgi:hypothetical protein
MIALFVEPKFPTVGTAPVKIDDLRKALASLGPVMALGVEALKKINAQPFRLLVLPYGSAFPKDAWQAIYAYLENGGNLLVLGGRPFEQPVGKSPKGWTVDPPQTAYYQSLAIEQLNTVSAGTFNRIVINHEEPWLENCELPPVDSHSLMVRLTDIDEDKGRTGTVGPMNDSLVPLCWGVDSQNRRMACPASLIEHRQGKFDGGRWVFAACRFTGWGKRETEWAVRLASCALLGTLEVEVRPTLACYNPGDQPDLTWWVRGHRTLKRHVRMEWSLSQEGAVVREGAFETEVGEASRYGTEAVSTSVEPGFYKLETRVSVDGHWARTSTQGFWGWDEELVKNAPPWGVSGDQFQLEGRDQSVVGTTYMAGDVSRKFITHPNPAVWDRDFSEMEVDGINLVRTGFWTMHRQIMMDSGRTREDVLRAMDAFVLTALRHRMPLVITFFSFIPDAWPSDHPYLDPRALSAQKEFMLSFVSRYARIPCVGWDFINEPSVTDPNQLWRTRPIPNNVRETDAFRTFLQGEWIDLDELRRRWNATTQEIESWDQVKPPCELDFNEWVSPQDGVTHMGIAFDFQRYGQDVFARWVAGHVKTLRETTGQTFCVGQNSGGVTNRWPSNHMFHGSLDYTCNHTWWENEDLLFAVKAPAVKGKPFLVQETGVMFTNNLSREKRCGEDENGRLFERKLASSFMNGSGFVQWCWNINAWMNERNEVEIGAHRADRTTRPEGLVLAAFGEFFKKTQEYLQGPLEEAPLAVVQSFTGLWSSRSHTDYSQRSSHWALGALSLPFQTLGENEAGKLTSEKVILLPAVHRIGEAQLQDWIRAAQGRTLVVSGPVAQDGYGRPHEGLSAFGVEEKRAEVLPVETVSLSGYDLPLTFSQGKPHRVDKDAGLDAKIHSFKKGKAHLLYQPVPVEAGDSRSDVVAYYETLLTKAGIKPLCQVEDAGGAGAGVMVYPRRRKDTVLYVAFNESAKNRRIKVKDGKFGFTAMLNLPSGRAALAVFDAKGKCLASYQQPVF